ncbi:D-sedoheptulose-7-phosphate isomerase [Flavobacterium ajazii]|uniref:D-sedoheptulose-7-phosphate isomerase n=1 Tax=Flavobacterium ajazii TaxID=2692318 RepID=UPI0013D5C077|nr:SIS domain-containing protein [Flavobacterium ajazii]
MSTNIKFTIKNYFDSHVSLFEKMDISEINEAIELLKSKYITGNKIITCGNGGSAYTASHYITDWNKMVNIATGNKFNGVSLCDNIGLITAFGNDMNYDEIFSGQLKSIMQSDDLLIVVSGSGNSPNVIKALEYANSIGAETLAIVGYDGGKAKEIAKKCIWIPSYDMQLCEDIHLMFGHMVMKELCGADIKS